jgi:pSer/pThr/pTyr-binding forkhead associated (FHA) protein
MSAPRAAWIVSADGQIWNLRNLELPVQIGRSDDADLIVKQDTVSRIHALIDWDDDAHQISDNKSENGTRVDAIPLLAGQVATLTDGSVIHLGTARLTYFLDGVRAARFAAEERAAANPR